jgi:uncharacterized protein (TIGR03086 family)
MSEPSHADLLLLFQRAQAQFTDRVDAVESGQWDAPVSPGRTVADLVAQLTRAQLEVPPLLAGEPADLPTDTDELVGTDPLTAWETAADGALAAWADPDVLDRTVELPSGPVPAADHLAGMTAALTVHTWDLARAVDGDAHLDPELVAAALRYAERHAGEDDLPGLLAAPVDPPAGADLQTRLLARFGRRG